MSPEELRDRFILHGVRCSIKRSEVLLQTCVYCGNTKWNLECNPGLGVYHCWACNAGGRVDSLIKQMTGIAVHIPVQMDDRREYRAPVALQLGQELPFLGTPVAEDPFLSEYLKGRHLSIIDMAIYQMRAGAGGPWKNRVIVPLLEYWTRRIIGYMGRSILDENPKYLSMWIDRKCIIGYRTRSDVHVIVEGVMDGIRVHKAGFNSVVLIGTGAIKGAIEEWAARVPQAHNVIVLLDGDAPVEGEHLFWRILPIHERVKKVTLPPHIDPDSLEPIALEMLIMREIHPNLRGPCVS